MRNTDFIRKCVVLILAAACVAQALCCATGFWRRPLTEPADRPGFVIARNGRLYLDGRRYRFVGVNVYSLASFPPDSGKYYCGIAHADKDVTDIMDEVAAMGGNAIRLSAYQAFTEGGTDFSRLDMIVAEARKRGIRLVLTLENQWHDCTRGGYKYAEWYRSGYLRPYGGYRLSFVEYVRSIVSRYRDEPTILMWQIMNEAESRTSRGHDDPYALLAFAEEVSALIKSIDQRHLLSLGTSGVHRPGSGGIHYAMLAATAGIDIVEAHDYGSEDEALPDIIRWSHDAAISAGKPFFIGEVGVQSPPASRQERARLILDKLEAAWDAGIDGVLIWSYRAGDGTNRDFDSRDPVAEAVRRFTSSHPVR